MKNILLFTLFFAISLYARLNPFETTDQFNEQRLAVLEIMEQQQEKKAKENQKLIEIEQALEAKSDDNSDNPTNEKLLSKSSVQDVETFNIFNFVKISVVNDILTIKVNSKYKLKNQDILKEQNKMLFDFRADKSFYTVRKKIKNIYFKSFAVGTHQNKHFFRIVIDFPKDVTNYLENVDSETSTIVIQKI